MRVSRNSTVRYPQKYIKNEIEYIEQYWREMREWDEDQEKSAERSWKQKQLKNPT